MDHPKVATTHPFHEDLKAGRIYWWCACGLSEKQPYCDGSHKGTGFSPVKVQVDEGEKVWLCGCKASKKAPRCDGTHKEMK